MKLIKIDVNFFNTYFLSTIYQIIFKTFSSLALTPIFQNYLLMLFILTLVKTI